LFLGRFDGTVGEDGSLKLSDEWTAVLRAAEWVGVGVHAEEGCLAIGTDAKEPKLTEVAVGADGRIVLPDEMRRTVEIRGPVVCLGCVRLIYVYAAHRYRVNAADENVLAALRILRDTPSEKEVRQERRDRIDAFLRETAAWQTEQTVDVDDLRARHASVFSVVEGRDTVRPGDLMSAFECDCGEAVKALQTLWRLEIVSEDRDMGLRDVIRKNRTGSVTLQPDESAAAARHDSENRDRQLLLQARALAEGPEPLAVSTLMRELNVSYRHARKLLDMLGPEVSGTDPAPIA